jgi:hypothetical protein
MIEATQIDGSQRLAALQGRCTPGQAMDLFDALPGVPVDDITTGRWKGAELATGHPFDGLLVASGWYGKQFDSADSVHPLLFSGAHDAIFAIEPRRVPLSLVGRVPLGAAKAAARLLKVVEPAVRTRTPRARLRNVEHRGKVSAAMIYDHLPIVDVFRRVDERTLLGIMDMRGQDQPYFFVLRRDG